MELDDLKQAWQTLDRRLQQQRTLDLDLLRERKLDKARSSLRPLFWGQIAQLLFGVLGVLVAVGYWMLPLPASPLVILAGVLMHAYGVTVIIASGVVLGMIHGIDYTAPVVAIQTQLAKLRRAYIVSGMVTGLPWWVLWMIPVIVLAGLAGHSQGLAWLTTWLGAGMAVGAAGLLGTWWFHRWARQPGRERLAKKVDEGLTGPSLRKARARLEEIERFAQE